MDPAGDVRGAEKKLTFLARLTRDVTAVPGLPELFDRVLESLHEDVGFASCTIALLEEDNQEALLLVKATGIPPDSLELIAPRGDSPYWLVLDAKTPLHVPQTRTDPRTPEPQEGRRPGIYAPMFAGDRAVGVLSAHRSEGGAAFTSDDLDFLTVVARHLAEIVEVSRLHAELRTQAATDTLTRLASRQSFFKRLEAEIAHSRRSGRAFSIALLDLDEFKYFNDVYGYAPGDAALVRVAESLVSHIRKDDLAARFGGDEFILLFPETTRAQAEEILYRLWGMRVSVGDDRVSMSLTLSGGLASWPDDGNSVQELVRMADLALWRVKKPR